MALRGEARRESDEQYGNDYQHVDHAGNAVELGAENRRFHGGKGNGNEHGQAEVDARMHQVLVEMSAPEFGFEFRMESEPGEARPQLAGVRRIRRICCGKSIGAAHSLHRTKLKAARSMTCATLWSKKKRPRVVRFMSNTPVNKTQSARYRAR